jgi:hypothetical protein
MFKSRTLFVVGAGASLEAGLPTGAMLKEIIAKKLEIKYELYDQKSGDLAISQAVKEYVQEKNLSNFTVKAAWQIRDAMPQAPSIDQYIDIHRGDKEIELFGKLAIVRAILEAEKGSKLYFRPNHQKSMKFSDLSGTWYNSFWQLLADGTSKSEIDNIFGNIGLIVFNYDRCIEHFLVNAIRNYYRVDDIIAQILLSKLKIFHPYGVVGKLPWQTEPNRGVPFGGAEHGGPSLLEISRQIKTFTERVEEEQVLNAMRVEIEQSRVVVFLGFAFHAQNMELLKPTQECQVERTYATAYGFSDSDCEQTKSQLMDFLKIKYEHQTGIYR